MLTDDEVDQLEYVVDWSRWRIFQHAFGYGYLAAFFLLMSPPQAVREYVATVDMDKYGIWGTFLPFVLLSFIAAIPVKWVLTTWMARIYRKTWALLVNTDFPHLLYAKENRQSIAQAIFTPFKPAHFNLGKYKDDLNIWLVLVSYKHDTLVQLQAASKNERTLRSFRRFVWWANLFSTPNHMKSYARRLAYCDFLLNEPNMRWLKGWKYPWPRRRTAQPA